MYLFLSMAKFLYEPLIRDDRLKESDKKRNSLFMAAFKQKERDKKRLVDTVLKQLRQLVNEQSLQQFS